MKKQTFLIIYYYILEGIVSLTKWLWTINYWKLCELCIGLSSVSRCNHAIKEVWRGSVAQNDCLHSSKFIKCVLMITFATLSLRSYWILGPRRSSSGKWRSLRRNARNSSSVWKPKRKRWTTLRGPRGWWRSHSWRRCWRKRRYHWKIRHRSLGIMSCINNDFMPLLWFG